MPSPSYASRSTFFHGSGWCRCGVFVWAGTVQRERERDGWVGEKGLGRIFGKEKNFGELGRGWEGRVDFGFWGGGRRGGWGKEWEGVGRSGKGQGFFAKKIKSIWVLIVATCRSYTRIDSCMTDGRTKESRFVVAKCQIVYILQSKIRLPRYGNLGILFTPPLSSSLRSINQSIIFRRARGEGKGRGCFMTDRIKGFPERYVKKICNVMRIVFGNGSAFGGKSLLFFLAIGYR